MVKSIRNIFGLVLFWMLVSCLPAEEAGKSGQPMTTGNAGSCRTAILAKYVLTGEKVLQNAVIKIDDNGKILSITQDTGEDIEPGVIVIKATSHVVSPGFINSHDHLSYNLMSPLQELQCDYITQYPVRYDQRHDWRKGNRGHKKLPYESSLDPDKMAWFELRQLISGTTTIVSKGGVSGLCRNLGNDTSQEYKFNELREGLVSPKTVYDVFPLGDSGGEQYEHGTDYKSHPDPAAIKDCIYVPHVSEGVDQVARNEFYNLSSNDPGCVNILSKNLMMIHSVALLHEDAEKVAQTHTNLVWSPRSNLALYGNTSYVTLYKNLGVNICLSTDWSCSGSMNLLRELALVLNLNVNYFDNTFTCKEIWSMVTVNPAKALQVSNQVGDIEPGLFADLVAFKISSLSPIDIYKEVIYSPIENVSMVCRGGKIIYGDEDLVRDFPAKWNEMTVNGVKKLVDLLTEVHKSYNDLELANKDSYPLFFKGTPPDEPCGKPIRLANPQCPNIGLYPIYPASEDRDQDGVRNTEDNYPSIFNPIRPVDYLNKKGQCDLK